jgi:hypothetical protein
VSDPTVTVTVLDGAFQVITSFPMAGAPQDVPLDPGIYAVRRSDESIQDQTLIPVTAEREHVVV